MRQELCKGRQLSDLLGQRPIWLWTRGGAQDVLEHSHRSSMHAVCIQVKVLFPPAGRQFCRNMPQYQPTVFPLQSCTGGPRATGRNVPRSAAGDCPRRFARRSLAKVSNSTQRSKVIYTQSILAEQSTPAALLGCTERKIGCWQVKRVYAHARSCQFAFCGDTRAS